MAPHLLTEFQFGSLILHRCEPSQETRKIYSVSRISGSYVVGVVASRMYRVRAKATIGG